MIFDDMSLCGQSDSKRQSCFIMTWLNCLMTESSGSGHISLSCDLMTENQLHITNPGSTLHFTQNMVQIMILFIRMGSLVWNSTEIL